MGVCFCICLGVARVSYRTRRQGWIRMKEVIYIMSLECSGMISSVPTQNKPTHQKKKKKMRWSRRTSVSTNDTTLRSVPQNKTGGQHKTPMTFARRFTSTKIYIRSTSLSFVVVVVSLGAEHFFGIEYSKVSLFNSGSVHPTTIEPDRNCVYFKSTTS